MMFSLADDYEADARGRGLIQGIEFEDKSVACEISWEAFERGLIIETAGPSDEVLKALPPLTTDEEGLERGLEIMEESARAVLGRATVAVPSEVGSSENT